eukprot:scaffold3210_cov402-Prasinococcus_capsulatus_cf.AAC.15
MSGGIASALLPRYTPSRCVFQSRLPSSMRTGGMKGLSWSMKERTCKTSSALKPASSRSVLTRAGSPMSPCGWHSGHALRGLRIPST